MLPEYLTWITFVVHLSGTVPTLLTFVDYSNLSKLSLGDSLAGRSGRPSLLPFLKVEGCSRHPDMKQRAKNRYTLTYFVYVGYEKSEM